MNLLEEPRSLWYTPLYRPALRANVPLMWRLNQPGQGEVFDFWLHQLLCDVKIAFAPEQTQVSRYQRHISPKAYFFLLHNCG